MLNQVRLIQILSILLASLLLIYSGLVTAEQYVMHANTNPTPMYIVKDSGGKVVVVKTDNQSETELDIYTHLLPEADVESLRKGISVYSKADLDSLLEDFGR